MAKTLAVGMTTAKRRERYAFTSLESFREAGFPQQLHVFAEPGSHDLSDETDITFHQHKEQKRCFQNWRYSLTWLTENVEADWYMIIQDDVVYRDDTWELLNKAINCGDYTARDVGFLSPYASAGLVSKNMKGQKGWRPAGGAHARGKGFWGALTFCMPAASAHKLLALPRFRNHTHHRKVDVIVGNCFRDLKLARLICLPSLCDHIGRVSTLGRHRIRGISHGRRGFRFRTHANDRGDANVLQKTR